MPGLRQQVRGYVHGLVKFAGKAMKGKDAAQRFLAIIVIVAMLGVMGLPLSVIIFFAAVTYFIWRAVQHSEGEDTRRIFEFYLRANDILRGEDRRWYGFEIASVIERGERVAHSMIDPPPLVYFTLGALYHTAGNYERAVDKLAFVVENELTDERRRYNPSPELRRYVRKLRELENEPSDAPQTMAAVRSLDRARRDKAAALLNDSRARLTKGQAEVEQRQLKAETTAERLLPATEEEPSATVAELPSRNKAATPPRPIAEVLRDVYEEKKTA
jgi:hypothetical protein